MDIQKEVKQLNLFDYQIRELEKYKNSVAEFKKEMNRHISKRLYKALNKEFIINLKNNKDKLICDVKTFDYCIKKCEDILIYLSENGYSNSELSIKKLLADFKSAKENTEYILKVIKTV